jgi:exo-beta-1,3-glucanase (GH17 family)
VGWLIRWLGVILACSFAGVPAWSQLAPPDAINVAPQILHGLNFSPYLPGQDPNWRPTIPESQIRERLAIVRPHTRWVRTFGSTLGLEHTCRLAREQGLKCAMGAWLGREAGSPSVKAENELQIANLISAGQRGEVDIAIAGSEVLLRGDLSVEELTAYINQVKAALPGIPVTTADVYGVWLANPGLVNAVDVVLANYYSYWEGVSVENAVWSIHWNHTRLKTAVHPKPVIVSETGWPSAGARLGNAVPSEVNAGYFFRNFLSWASANNVEYFYFSAFDEGWKWREGVPENPVGPHWGIWKENGDLKQHLLPRLNGLLTPDTWSRPKRIGEENGIPKIEFTYVAPYGDTQGYVRGRAGNLIPSEYRAVVYIYVAGQWWVKPFGDGRRVLGINAEGEWGADITTGGIDEVAERVAAFLIPAGYLPQNYHADKAAAVASAEAQRTVRSISGRVTDPDRRGLANVPVQLSGKIDALTMTDPEGRFSFYDLPEENADYALRPLRTGSIFSPRAKVVTNLAGRYLAGFTLQHCGGDFQGGCRPDQSACHGEPI